MNAIFISDLHLEDSLSSKFHAFCNLLQNAVEKDQEIYILGDLTEVWVGDDDDSELADTLRDTLKAFTKQTSIYLMYGNRDFLYGSQFTQDTGVKLIEDPFTIEMQSETTLLAHGDVYCTDDIDYQRARSQLRSDAGIQQLLSMTLPQRRELALDLRARSKAANELKPSNIMDVSPVYLEAEMNRRNCRSLIHGHTHRPGIHKESWGIRYVLGSWEYCGWFLEMTPSSSQLRCFAIQ